MTRARDPNLTEKQTTVMRKHRSATERLKLFLALEGRCYLCGGIIHPGQAWDVEHETPLSMGGADDHPNLRLAHSVKCHRSKTAVDMGVLAKAKRREIRHAGAKPKKPWPKRKFRTG